MMKKSIILVATLASLPLAHAFEDVDARRAILELRAQMRQSQDARADLQNQIQTLQQQIAQLRGTVETDSVTDQTNGSQTGSSFTPQVGNPVEQNAYDTAMGLYRKGLYAQASSALTQFANTYPNSTLAPLAQFYAGSADYANKSFDAAINGLNNLVTTYPNHAKAPDALLVVSAAQVEENHVNDAKQTLLRILKFYPNSPAADTAKERLKFFK